MPTRRAPDLVAEPLLTTAEVAAMFRVRTQTVTRWAETGWLTSIRTPGGHYRYRASEVDELLELSTSAPGGIDGEAGQR